VARPEAAQRGLQVPGASGCPHTNLPSGLSHARYPPFSHPSYLECRLDGRHVGCELSSIRLRHIRRPRVAGWTRRRNPTRRSAGRSAVRCSSPSWPVEAVGGPFRCARSGGRRAYLAAQGPPKIPQACSRPSRGRPGGSECDLRRHRQAHPHPADRHGPAEVRGLTRLGGPAVPQCRC
jgi:hypothetical protein